MENVVVLIRYLMDAFHDSEAMRAFICMDVSLSTRKILDT